MIKNKTTQKVYFFIGDILTIINRLIPKSKNKILFFSANTITDNSKALLDYLLENGYNSKYKIVCCAYDLENYKNTPNVKLSKFNPFSGVFHIFTSKYIFFHGEIIAIKPTKSQLSISLWHGTPLKRFNKTADKLSDYKYNFFTYMLASSDFFKPIMRDCFDCSLDQVKVLGHARNDLLFKKSNSLEKLNINKSNYNKVFLWMPTYRISKDKYIIDTDSTSETGLPIFPTEKTLQELNEHLNSINSIILIKLHPAQNLDFIKMNNYPNIRFLTNADIEKTGYHLYNLVSETDSLITDYSSIYFDYLLLDRPIGFTIDDIDSYIKNRGFVLDNPYEFMPGQKIKTIDEFKHFLSSVNNNIDNYSEDRKKINDIANKYQDNLNCKRIVEFTKL